MQIDRIFINFVAKDQLDLDNDTISNFCLEKIKNNSTDVSQSRLLDYTQCAELKPLYDTIEEKLAELHTQFNFSKHTKFVINDTWCTLDTAPNTSAIHNHGSNMFSVVYYPHAPENCPPIEFLNPNPVKFVIDYDWMIEDYNNFNSSMIGIVPKTGMLLIFPSWLLHYVRKIDTTETGNRISIATDTKLVMK